MSTPTESPSQGTKQRKEKKAESNKSKDTNNHKKDKQKSPATEPEIPELTGNVLVERDYNTPIYTRFDAHFPAALTRRVRALLPQNIIF